MKAMVLVAALALAAPACNQDRSTQGKLEAKAVPFAVRGSLTQHFADAQDVIWRKRLIRYEASFWDHGTRKLAWFLPEGRLVETQAAVAPGALPAPVRRTLATDYGSYRVIDASQTTMARTGKVTYHAELERAGKTKMVDLRNNGQVTRF